MIDVNISLSRWPFRRLPLDETASLVTALKKQGFTQAWAGSFDGILHRDVEAVNLRLAAECRSIAENFLIPFGTVNPTLPDWQEDLKRCHERHKMPGIRLHPNYHGYSLADPTFNTLLDLAAERSLIVQISVLMEDDRTQHPMLKAAPVDVSLLSKLVVKHPKLSIVLLNSMGRLRGLALKSLLATGQIYVDTATLEAVAGIEHWIEANGSSRLMIGSHAPFFALEAVNLKLQESIVNDLDRQAITINNARSLLSRS
jgi:hypothetical protein